jgi:CubicO group peptidase (beta-lactamase class C family)
MSTREIPTARVSTLRSFFENEQTAAILNAATKNGWWSGYACGVTHDGKMKLEYGGNHAAKPFTYARYPVGPNSQWDIGSLTKVIISILTLHAVKSGLCCLDSKITHYVRTLRPQGNCPTVRDLLAFGVEFDLRHLEKPYASMNGEPLPTERLWEEILNAKISISRFRYSNYAPFILARMLEKVTNMSIEKLAKKVIFDPLRLQNTTFRSEDVTPDHLVIGECADGKPIDGVHDELSRALYPRFSGAAGIFSTAPDLMKIVEMLLYPSKLRDHIISPEHVRVLGQNQIRPDVPDVRPKRIRSGLGFGLVSELMEGFNMPKCVERDPALIEDAYFRTSFGGSMMAFFPKMNSAMLLCTNYVHPTRKVHSEMAAVRHAMICSMIFGEFVPEGHILMRTPAS